MDNSYCLKNNVTCVAIPTSFGTERNIIRSCTVIAIAANTIGDDIFAIILPIFQNKFVHRHLAI